MALRIYPKIEFSGKEYVIFGSDRQISAPYNRTLKGSGEIFPQKLNINTSKTSLYWLGISVDQFDWRYHGKHIFDPVDSDHTFYKPDLEVWHGREFNIVSFSDSLECIEYRSSDIGYGIGCDKKWADNLLAGKKLKDIKDPLSGPKLLIPDEYFLAGEVEEDQGYTEGYKNGHSGLRWL